MTGPTAAPDTREVVRDTVAQIVRLATEYYWDGWRRQAAPDAVTGLAAIERYATDIADPANTMQDAGGSTSDTCFFERGWGCRGVHS